MTLEFASVMIHDAPKGTSSFMSITKSSFGAIISFHAIPLFFREGNLSCLIASQNPVGNGQDGTEASEKFRGQSSLTWYLG